MAVGGFIKLHRSLLRHWAFADDAVFYLWINLLMRANWKDGKFWPGGASGPIDVRRGQLVTGRNALHAMLFPKRDSNGKVIKRESKPPHATTLWRWLEAMQNDGMIALDVRSKFTIVTVCNYDTYQNYEPDDAQGGAPMVRKSCADGAPMVRTIEEDKELKEGEEVIPPNPQPADDFLAAWNSTAGTRPVRKLTDRRATAIKARLADPDWDWRAALAKFPLKCFAAEQGGYVPDVDFFLRPDTVTKILEGKYDWSKSNGTQQSPTHVGPGQRYRGE